VTGVPVQARGAIALDEAACTSCMICVRECPDWCIHLDSHQERLAEPHGRRARTVNVLDRFAIDWGLCMYCGICVDVCPVDALAWVPDHDYPATTAAGLVHERDRLGAAARGLPDRPGAVVSGS
jgi:NADH-quinone oxidoreductase subunit I